MSQTLLVTGGAGFIGSNFILYWLANHPEDKIINLDALTYAGNLANLDSLKDNPHYVFVEGNINDADLVNRIMDDVQVVVHFAAESHVDRSIKQPLLFLQTNILGTQVLLESARQNKISRFHHISTDEVFGALPLDTTDKFSEETRYNPRSPYSASKASSDHLVRAYGDTYGLPYTITNCSNNYGPYQFPEKLIALTITNLIDHQPVPIYGDGQYVRDWLHVTDHCRAIEAVLEKGQLGETYLVGGLTKDISNLEITKLIIKLMGQDEQLIKYVTDRPGHDRRYTVNWQKIQRELNWKPSVSLEDGLKQTISWYQDNEAWWRPLKEKQKAWFAHQYQLA